MLEKLRKRFQHCCSTPRRLRNKRNVGSCNFCNNSQQHATTCKRVCNRIQGIYSGSNVIALVLLTFMGNVNKRQHLKICLLKCDKIWQKSCSYQTSVNEGLKTKVEQTSFVAYSNFSWKLFCQKFQKLFLKKYVFFPVTFLKK